MWLLMCSFSLVVPSVARAEPAVGSGWVWGGSLQQSSAEEQCVVLLACSLPSAAHCFQEGT